MSELASDVLQDKRILLGVTGSIAAFKAALLVTRLRERGALVRVVMTRAATKFVTPLTFAALSGHEVGVDMFEAPRGDESQHIHLQDFAEAMLVAPATANILGKVAAGIADDLLSTVIMAVRCPVLFAPAMNVQMWNNPVVQQNVRRLQEAGYGFVMPEAGRLASGAYGAGRLAREEFLLSAIERALQGFLPQRNLQGKKVVVSAGPTQEPIDPVRFLSNPSSGRMGYALAAEAHYRGADVVLISGPTELSPPPGVETHYVQTTAQMKEAVLAAMPGAWAYLSAAAPADYRPAHMAETKIKKSQKLTLELEPTEDILQAVNAQARPPILVGFAAETGDAVAKARAKLLQKNLDLLVVNDVSEPSSGFKVDTNRVTLLHRDGRIQPLPLMSKQAVAAAIWDAIMALE